jgi:hypothetical protein
MNAKSAVSAPNSPNATSRPIDQLLAAARAGDEAGVRQGVRSLLDGLRLLSAVSANPMLRDLRRRHSASRSDFRLIDYDRNARSVLLSLPNLLAEPDAAQAWAGREEALLRLAAAAICEHWRDAAPRLSDAPTAAERERFSVSAPPPPPLGAVVLHCHPPIAAAMIPFMVEQGADPIEADETGSTPLMFAASLGEPDLIERLLPFGGARMRDGSGTDALLHATPLSRLGGDDAFLDQWARAIELLLPSADFSRHFDERGRSALPALLIARAWLGNERSDALFAKALDLADADDVLLPPDLGDAGGAGLFAQSVWDLARGFETDYGDAGPARLIRQWQAARERAALREALPSCAQSPAGEALSPALAPSQPARRV